jgi:hypothetical protein
MAQRVGCDVLIDPGQFGTALDGLAQAGAAQVVAPNVAGSRIGGEPAGGEDPLPDPGSLCMRVLAFESVGQVDAAETLVEVLLVEALGSQQLVFEAGSQPSRKLGEAILGPFAIPDHDLELGKVHVLDAQSDALTDAQPATVEKLGHQLVGSCDTGEKGLNLILGEDRGQVAWALSPHGLKIEVEGLEQDVFVEEGDGVEGLVLGGGGDLLLDGEVREESFDFGLAEVGGVAFVVEEDEAAHPVDVGSFGGEGVVFALEDVAKAI